MRKIRSGQNHIPFPEVLKFPFSTVTGLNEVIAKAGCIPFVRVPSANVGDIQKATDAGAVGDGDGSMAQQPPLPSSSLSPSPSRRRSG